MSVDIEVQTLPFKQLWDLSIKNVWKLIDIMRFQFTYYKVITQRGIEFDRLREYTPGDDARFIDWNAYARTGKPHVKVFKEERKLDIIFVLDTSTTMTLGTVEWTKNQYASVLITTMALAVQALGDKVALISFSDGIKHLIDPSLSIDTVLQMADLLCRRETWGGRKEWEKIVHPILETFSMDSYLFIISDFIGEKSGFYDFLLKAANHFAGVGGIMVRDPMDSHIPEGIGRIYIQDPETGEIVLVDADEIRYEYNAEAEREEREINRKFVEAGALYTKTLTTNRNIPNVIMELFGESIWK